MLESKGILFFIQDPGASIQHPVSEGSYAHG